MTPAWEVTDGVLRELLLDHDGTPVHIRRWRIVDNHFMPIDVPDMPRKVPVNMTRQWGDAPIFETGTGRIVGTHKREPDRISGTFEDGTAFDHYVMSMGATDDA